LEYDPFLAASVRIDDVLAFVGASLVAPKTPALEESIFIAQSVVFISFPIKVTLVVFTRLQKVPQVGEELID
jgi:hypothetical protein